MAGKDLKSIVDRIVDLPTLPQVVTTIMSLIEDPDSSAKDINAVMSNDPALVGKMLKLVNSAFYGLPNKISSIQQAITILGFNTVRSLAISASVFDLFGDGEEEFSYEEFWTHSIGTAAVGRILAEREPGTSPDSAFVIGLLHGMGKLVLDQYAPVEFQEILKIAREESLSFAEAEARVLDTSYADIGFWLTNKWQLAEDVQVAIQFQNRIPDCPDPVRPSASVLAFASYVCRVKDYGANGDFDKPRLPREAWEVLHIDKDDVPKITGRINEAMEGASDFLQVIND